MLILVAILTMLIMATALLVIRLFKPDFAYHWILACLAVVISFILILLSRPIQPQVIWSGNWQPEILFPDSPGLLLDSVSWTFTLAVIAMTMASLLTAVIRQPVAGWRTWSGSLVLTCVGLLAVLAENPLTLMLSWAAIDCFEVWILFDWVRRSEVRQQIMIVMSARVLGIAFLILASLIAQQYETHLSFSDIPVEVSGYLLIAAGLRLGVLPLHAPFLQDRPIRKDLGTPLRLVPAAASLMLLVRTASSNIPATFVPWLLALTALAGIYSVVSWYSLGSELSGRSFWILGVASLAVVAAIRSQPLACLVWSLACILTGSFLFMFTHRSRLLNPVGWIVILAFSALPLTPTWAGLGIYSIWAGQLVDPLNGVFDLIFAFTHLFLILGAIGHLFRQTEPVDAQDRTAWFFYIPGLILLLVTHFYIGSLIFPGVDLREWRGWLGAVVFIWAIILWLLIFRNPRFLSIRQGARNLTTPWISVFGRILSMEWIYGFVGVVYHFLDRVINWATMVLEGEGGMLWAVILFLLLFSLSQQAGISK